MIRSFLLLESLRTPILMQAVLLARYGPGSRYNISDVEQIRFVQILLNALDATIGTGLSPEALVAIEDRLHATDNQVVQQEGNNCNFGRLHYMFLGFFFSGRYASFLSLQLW
jgi:hypothetical protein